MKLQPGFPGRGIGQKHEPALTQVSQLDVGSQGMRQALAQLPVEHSKLHGALDQATWIVGKRRQGGAEGGFGGRLHGQT